MTDFNQQLLNAVKEGNLAQVRNLFAQAANIQDPSQFEDLNLVELAKAINTKDYTGNTLLHLAALYGNLPIVQYLVEVAQQILGFNIDVINDSKDTALHLAARQGYLPIVQYLVENGASVESVNDENRTPLYEAVTYKHLPIVKYLAEHGSNINIIDKYGLTPLHMAAYVKNIPIAEYLIDRGADRTIQDNEGRTPADLARSEEIRKVIQTRARPIWTPNIHSWRATPQEKEQIKELMKIRMDIDQALSAIPRELMFELFGHLVQ